MRPSLRLALLGVTGALGVTGMFGVTGAPGARADEPVPADKDDACLSLNNRILGPRSGNRRFPLLSGDPAHGLHSACAVSWSTLSPKNQALPVIGCFRGSLLQVETEAACGQGRGPLWVSSRWVVTSAELRNEQKHGVVCQQLETGAWAGTRDFHLDCETRRKELSEPGAKPPAGPAQATPNAGPPHTAAPKAVPPGAAPTATAPPPHPEH